ncbi:DHA2 family efflux MFS transporter permease subunit [Actinoallomurus sp. CA-150999]|uniref:DHA2 family efflux MFS transporter permease subunit n=1 Tax=Actinoallomurus sp. CA-150999 TaxID=3239887 RepID=UPI003D8B4744
MSRPSLRAEERAASHTPGTDRLDPALVRLALVLMLGAVAAGLDMTIVTVAIGTLGRHFHASVATIQWVSTGYLLALSMVIPLTGWSVERFGARRMWLVSLALFLGGSVLCGAAWSIGSLIVFRVLQGVGGGMLLPLVRTILAQAAGRERMGRAMTFVVVPGSVAPALGPVLGGLLVDVNWRWAFFVNVPICLLAIALAWRVVPRGERQSAGRLDALGLALLSVGLAAVVYGLSEAGNRGGFTSGPVVGALAAGVTLLAAYAVHALRTRITPIIDVRLFRVRSFSAASVLGLLLGASLFGAMFLVPLYYQDVRGTGVLEAGLLLAPRAVGSAVAMFFVGRLVDRTGAERAVTLAGMALAVAGTVPFALAGPQTSRWLLGVALFVAGLGIGTVLLTAMTATYRGLSASQLAPATSASRIMQQIGGSFGTVLLALVLQHQSTMHTASAAFRQTFVWSLALTTLALIPAFLLPRAGREDSA